ncbi:MAG: 3-keto-5-aminohexanoate cleavage protein, partial [Actinomycetota bacterium]
MREAPTPTPVIIEAAINGASTKDRNPNTPVTPEEITADALACIDAGATVVHNHIDRVMLPGEEAAARYREAWDAILAVRPDALLYPTTNFG